jgi:8-oxo-dGTP pyrophosphatase MutT (NUDIX family)
VSALPLSYGGVVLDAEGRVLLRKPKCEFDGYVWTFPKGRPDPGETPEQTAVREVSEETGCLAKPLAPIGDTFRGGTTENRYFLMTPISVTPDFTSSETQEVRWAPIAEAAALIASTRNSIGRERDLAVLAAAEATHSSLSR